MMAARLATIVPCYGKADETDKCLRSLERASCGPGHEVVVVENGTSENVAALASRWPRVRFLSLPENRGFAAALNRGVAFAREQWDPEYYFWINNDAQAREGSLAALLRLMAERPDCGLAAPKVLFESDPSLLWSAGGEWIPWRFLSRNRRLGEKDAGMESARECAFLPGCALLVRKQAWESIGALDENFFLYAEDLDYCLRAAQRGWKLVYCPQAAVLHAGSATAGGEYDPFQSFYRWRNRFYAASKHAGRGHKIFLYGLFFPALMLRDALTYLRKRKWESFPYLWKGFLQFLRWARLGSGLEPLRPADLK